MDASLPVTLSDSTQEPASLLSLSLPIWNIALQGWGWKSSGSELTSPGDSAHPELWNGGGRGWLLLVRGGPLLPIPPEPVHLQAGICWGRLRVQPYRPMQGRQRWLPRPGEWAQSLGRLSRMDLGCNSCTFSGRPCLYSARKPL